MTTAHLDVYGHDKAEHMYAYFMSSHLSRQCSMTFSPWAKSRYLTCQYHQRGPHVNVTNLFRYIYSKYFFLLDIPNSQPKPANLHKQNGRRPKRVLPYIDHSPYPSCIPSPQECIRPILFCSWNLSEHEKWMSPSPNWDVQPVGRHFQNGRHPN